MENKKWMQPVMFGILVANLIVIIVLSIFTIPALGKINKLMVVINDTIVASSSGEEGEEGVQIPLEQQEMIKIETEITANLKSADDERHIIKFAIGVSINKKGKDYKKLKSTITANGDFIINEVRYFVSEKTYQDITKQNGTQILAEEIAKLLNEKLGTQDIVNVIFTNIVYS